MLQNWWLWCLVEKEPFKPSYQNSYHLFEESIGYFYEQKKIFFSSEKHASFLQIWASSFTHKEVKRNSEITLLLHFPRVSLHQTWPNWGPPKIFCGPCSKILMINNLIWGLIMSKITINWGILGWTWDKETVKILLWPSVLFVC